MGQKSFDVTWEKVHREKNWGMYPSEEVIRFTARNFYLRNRGKTRLLDMGCGTGAITWYLAREGFAVSGFDGSRTAILKAKDRLRRESLSAKLQVRDAARLPYRSGTFDGIIDSGMIVANLTRDIKKILKEAHRVLRPGGKFLSTKLFVIGMKGFGTGKKLEKHTFQDMTRGNLQAIGTVHFFSKKEVRRLWTAAGFHSLKIDRETRTDHGGKSKVDFLVVEAEK
jgi:ubiquinone/menaquinone biosynthesis C-methylase UbiE